jgi:hypothetical protein
MQHTQQEEHVQLQRPPTPQQQQQDRNRWSQLQLLERLRQQVSMQGSTQDSAAASPVNRNRRRRQRLRLSDAGDGTDVRLPVAAALPSRTAAAAASTGGAAVSAAAVDALLGAESQQVESAAGLGFTHGQRLPALRQQALLQMTQTQLEAAQSAADPEVAAAATAGLAAAATHDTLQTTGRGDPAAAWHQQQGTDSHSQQLDASADASAAKTLDSILTLVAKAARDQQSCFTMFNPPTEAEYRRVVGDWLASFLLMMRHMAAGEGYKTVETAVSQHRHSRG